MAQPTDSARFAEMALPHLDAAYNLARWLTRDPSDASDVVQEAMMRALRFFGGFRRGNGKSWLLAIVRNTAFDWMKANRPAELQSATSDGGGVFGEDLENFPSDADDPETALIRAMDRRELVLQLHFRSRRDSIPPVGFAGGVDVCRAMVWVAS